MPTLLRNIATPRSLLANPDRFGGQQDAEMQRGDLLVMGDHVIGFTQSPPEGARTLNGKGRILLPGLAEPHLHLDKAFTLPRLGPVGGDLLAAIAAQEADKAKWTDDDLRARATRALHELQAAGVTHARTHVDWGIADAPNATPRAWDLLSEVAQDWAGKVTLTLSCLPGIDAFADPATADRITAEVRRVGGALGAWCLNHPHRAAGFAGAFARAARHGLALDFHIDEGQDETLDGLAMIAAEALRTGFDEAILCGHAVSLMNQTGPHLDRLLDDLASAGISLCALPTTNLYLQSRGQGTPDRRGITRLTEAGARGVNTCLGTDNVQDAFYPLGRHDPLLTLATAVPALHLDPPLSAHLPLVSTHAARAMGLPPGFADRATLTSLFLADATDMPSLLSHPARRQPLAEYLAAPAS